MITMTENDVIKTLHGIKNSPRDEKGDAYFSEYGNCEIKITGCPKGIAHYNQLRPKSDCQYMLIDTFHKYVFFLTKEQMHDEIYKHKCASMSHKTDREWSIILNYNAKKKKEKTQQKFKRFECYRNIAIENQIFN